jgi:predicted secreted protein
MAAIDGYDVLMTIGGQTLLGQTTAGIDFTGDSIDITTKDSNKWKEYLIGEKGGNLTVDTLFSVDTDTSDVDTSAIFASFKDGEPIDFKLGSRENDEWYFEGEAVITGMNFSFPKNEAASNSISLLITGEPDLVIAT